MGDWADKAACGVGGLVGAFGISAVGTPLLGMTVGTTAGCAAGVAVISHFTNKSDPKLAASAEQFKKTKDQPFVSAHTSTVMAKALEQSQAKSL